MVRDASILVDSNNHVIGTSQILAKHGDHRMGFTYQNRVDPFDGGPHFEALLSDISLIKHAKTGVLKIKKQPHKWGLIGCYYATAKDSLVILLALTNSFNNHS